MIFIKAVYDVPSPTIGSSRSVPSDPIVEMILHEQSGRMSSSAASRIRTFFFKRHPSFGKMTVGKDIRPGGMR